MPATFEEISNFLNREDTTAEEKFAVEWQYAALSTFNKNLLTLICSADEWNLLKLKSIFPMEVEMYQNWAHGNLAAKIRKKGLNI